MDAPISGDNTVAKVPGFKIYLIAMACLGYQLSLGIILSLADPLMTQLKLGSATKFATWTIGPITGFFVPPIVGYYSDRCKSKYGRRRPFILIGGIFTVLGLFALYLLRKFASKLETDTLTTLYLTAILVTFIANNVMQGPTRSIIGDILPTSQHGRGFAIASVLIGLGSVFSNLIGGCAYFTKIEWYYSNAFPVTFILGAIITCITIAVTCFAAKEQQFTGELDTYSAFSKIWSSLKHMSVPMSRASWALMVSWIGYCSYLVKCTTFFAHEVFPDSQMNKGLCFGLFVNTIVNFVSFIYGLVHNKCMKLIGVKVTYSVSHAIMALCLAAVFFTQSKWVLLGLMAPLGIAFTVFGTVPFHVASLDSTAKDLGVNIGILNIFATIGQQICTIINSLIGTTWEHWPWLQTKVGVNQAFIAFGTVGSIVATIMSFYLIVPSHDGGNGGSTDGNNEASMGAYDPIKV